MKTVHLGFEVGTGAPVAIPLRHLAVTGQTQEAGKTTTLEALIERSQLRAVTFVTKRGEGSFRNARRIEPYFREQTDWQFVASILEASRGEKLKFERAWIIRASKGARTLADVQANVRAGMEKARGLAADVYLTLDAYLDVVVPQIASVKWAHALELAPGVNAMDLSALAPEMQHLVIRSAITWVQEREHGTVVVVPEAWKFIPQGRGTPVKLAAESFIRQGAALGNYLWLDSQDLGGIEKAILRSVPVWLLGVQREANEIKRTLDNIPAGTHKPKPGDIAQLQLGEFFACWGAHTVKTYVQPAWMGDHTAVKTARGVDMGARTQREEAPEVCERHVELERRVADLERQLRLEKETTNQAVRDSTAVQARAAAADALGRALAALWPAAEGGVLEATPIDEDAIVARVLAKVPTNGHVVQVTPPEALRLQVQRDVAQRIVAAAKGLPPAAKRLLKVLIALDKRISQRAAAERTGLAWGGSVIEAYKALSDEGLIDSHKSNGTRAAVRDRIVEYLGDLGAKEPEVEAVYQTVLHAIATEA